MIVGVPREIKPEEYRVAVTPTGVRQYVAHGHRVLVETNAGAGSGFDDDAYAAAGATMLPGRDELFDRAEMIVKVKEPLEEEWALLHEGQVLYTYLHLAANKPLTRALLDRRTAGVAYETVQLDDGSLPLLTPMSEIAGRLSVLEGAKYLQKPYGGRGVLIAGVPGIHRGRVLVIGAGVVGANACRMAFGLGAEVTVLDVNPRRLAHLDDLFRGQVTTLYSNTHHLEDALRESDLVIGAVLIPGAAAPRLIGRDHLKQMKPGAVLVDVAVDQGGCFETTRATRHSDPVYVECGIVHYAVANMPGAVSRSATLALADVTLPYGLMIADHGLAETVKKSQALRRGVNVLGGRCTHPALAESLGLEYAAPW